MYNYFFVRVCQSHLVRVASLHMSDAFTVKLLLQHVSFIPVVKQQTSCSPFTHSGGSTLRVYCNYDYNYLRTTGIKKEVH